MYGFWMARLPEKEQAELAAMIDAALDRTRGMHRLEWYQIADALGLDEAQLGRMRVGKESFDLRRLLKLAQQGLLGDFVAFLLDEAGGWDAVAARGFVILLEPFLASRGLARMARVNAVSQKENVRVA